MTRAYFGTDGIRGTANSFPMTPEVAMRVGKLIQSMAERHQVLVITHSAQMASRAQAHWKVEKSQAKESTETRVRRLSAEDSLQEIAAMISGNAPGKAALEAARELINA
jgi:DNA repair protein RecN (Recombination protein N)